MSSGAEEVLTIEDETIDVEAVMSAIDRRVEERRASGVYDESEIAQLMAEVPSEGADQSLSDPLHELNFCVRLASLTGQVTTEFPMGSGRKVIGPLIVFTKKVIRRLMRTYIDAVFRQQNEFNASMVKALELLEETIRERREREAASISRVLSYRLEAEDRETVQAMLEPVVQLLQGQQVVELASGRGDFLEAARRAGLEASGVEGEEALVRLCQEQHLGVVNVDPFVYLAQAPGGMLPAVFWMDMGERMQASDLIWSISAVAFTMAPGGMFAVCNHKPDDPEGRASLERDPTILRPIYPETLRHLLEGEGYEKVRVISLGSRYLLTARRT
ncbi:MAG: methyltransferase domain-containing protein [Candidatus Geothermincolia bacterium]